MELVPWIAGVARQLGNNTDGADSILVNKVNTRSIRLPLAAQPLNHTLQVFVAWTVLYGISIAASKWAILLLYLRVFTTCNRIFNMTVYLMGFIITATALANTFVAILQCSPISYAWDDNVHSGTCIDTVAFNRYMGIPNVITGIVMLIMPLPPVLRLNITVLQKVGLSATFLHGIV